MSRVIPPMLPGGPGIRDLKISIKNLLYLIQLISHTHSSRHNTTLQIGQIGPNKLLPVNLDNKDGEENLMGILPLLYLCHKIHIINLLPIFNNFFLDTCHLLYL